MNIIQELNAVIEALQNVEIQSTEKNLYNMLGSIQTLERIKEELEQASNSQIREEPNVEILSEEVVGGMNQNE